MLRKKVFSLALVLSSLAGCSSGQYFIEREREDYGLCENVPCLAYNAKSCRHSYYEKKNTLVFTNVGPGFDIVANVYHEIDGKDGTTGSCIFKQRIVDWDAIFSPAVNGAFREKTKKKVDGEEKKRWEDAGKMQELQNRLSEYNRSLDRVLQSYSIDVCIFSDNSDLVRTIQRRLSENNPDVSSLDYEGKIHCLGKIHPREIGENINIGYIKEPSF